jgi:hypothetical protein
MLRLIAMLAVAGGAALVLQPAPARAEILYPWCASYTGGENGIGATVCSFVSRQQCMATVQGMGAMCQENPAYPEATAPRPHRRAKQR